MPLPCRLSPRMCLGPLRSSAGVVAGRNRGGQPWNVAQHVAPCRSAPAHSVGRCPGYPPKK